MRTSAVGFSDSTGVVPAGASASEASRNAASGQRGRMSAGTGVNRRMSATGAGHYYGSPHDINRKSMIGDVRHEWRYTLFTRLQHSESYIWLKQFLRGKLFSGVMVLMLVLALLLPDFFVIGGATRNLELDIILMVVMACFTFEFVGLCLTDPSYLFGFFFYMDILGTVSLVFDISVFAGMDVTAPTFYDLGGSKSGSEKDNVVVLRAARAAKLGARAGRLSRVVKLLRFLPFLTGTKDAKLQSHTARVISNQLTNVLSTRVSCLTILLVVSIPLFSLYSYPEEDYSLTSWAQRLSRLTVDLEGGGSPNSGDFAAKDFVEQVRAVFQADLENYVDFYREKQYGPCKLCTGRQTGSKEANNQGFDCQWYPDWSPSFEESDRASFRLMIATDTLLAVYDFSEPIKFDSGMNIVLILCCVMVMVLFSLLLSNNVTELAINPMERMLDNIRKMAGTISQYTMELDTVEEGHEDEDEEFGDIEQSSEMALLEKLVKKLAVMADLNARKEIEEDEDMNDEDIGILNLMRSGGAGAHLRAPANREGKDGGHAFGPMATVDQVGGNSLRRQLTTVMRVEELGVTAETLHSWKFDPLELRLDQRMALSAWILYHNHGTAQLVQEKTQETHITAFVQRVQDGYLDNPYHHFAHGVDVLHTVMRAQKLTHTDLFLTMLEQYALLVAALCHDLGHIGVNNPFLVDTGNELALRYNDKSPLENMHCSRMFEILGEPRCNILQGFERDEYKEMRKIMIAVILHTDMAQHFSMMKEISMVYSMNIESFKLASPHDEPDPAEIEILRTPDNKKMVLSLLLHSADIANPCKPWRICRTWAIAVLEEFFAQGDQEKALGITVQMLNDRDKVNRPTSQIGFIEFIVAPFMMGEVKLFPGLYELTDNMEENLKMWEKEWHEESAPADEEKEKTAARVKKVGETLEEMKKARIDFDKPQAESKPQGQRAWG